MLYHMHTLATPISFPVSITVIIVLHDFIDSGTDLEINQGGWLAVYQLIFYICIMSITTGVEFKVGEGVGRHSIALKPA